MKGRLDWTLDGANWPHRASSQFIKAGGLTWHCQITGQGPDLLLIHGTGASTHSWRQLIEPLSQKFRVIVPDLPGHAFSDPLPGHRLSLPGMAHALAQLVTTIGAHPSLVVGHSAGAAIALDMALHHSCHPHAIISLNGALLPFGGIAGQIFPSMARMLVLNPFVPRFFAWRAEDPHAVTALIEGTGSRLDEEGLDFYRCLFRSRAHVAATLGMMANWDLDALNRSLGDLNCPLVLVAATGDKAVSPDAARTMKQRFSKARFVLLRQCGHLCHEEKPQEIIDLIIEVARQNDVLPAA